MCFNNGNNNCSCLWLIIIVVLICRFKTSIFFAPYWVPIKIEAPIHIPFTNKIASVINGLLVPTAANASFPTS